MTSSVTNRGKAFARIALPLASAAMGIYVASSDPPGGAVVGFLLMLAAVLFGVGGDRSGGRRSHCRVRGISHPFDQDRGTSLRASSGRAVGQRVGTVVTIDG